MSILAVIPARGGSKAIPRKNVKNLGGRPLIAYTINAAQSSELINRVVVSTDDQEIGDVARGLGAEVPFMRPEDLASDEATDLGVFQHCLEWLRNNDAYEPEIVVHLRPTAPLRRAEHIDESIRLLQANPDADSVRTVCRASQHPLKSWIVKDGWLQPFVEPPRGAEPYNQPRQKLPEAFVQNGSVDVLRPHLILEEKTMTGSRIMPLVMDELESVNIDSPVDWLLAEALIAADSRGG